MSSLMYSSTICCLLWITVASSISLKINESKSRASTPRRNLTELSSLPKALHESKSRASTPRRNLTELSSLPKALQDYLSELHGSLAISSGRVNSFAQNPQECMIFGLAYEYALRLLPERAPNIDVWNALMLGPNCGALPPPSAKELGIPNPWPPAKTHSIHSNAGPIFYVSPTGSDLNSGTLDSPFATLSHAVDATRTARSPGAGPATIILRAGIHILTSTISLDTRDQYLSILNYPSEEAWVSGGSALSNLNWQPINVSAGGANVYAAHISSPPLYLTGLNSVTTTGAPSKRLYRAQYPNFNPEWHSTGACDHTRSPECLERIISSPLLQTHRQRYEKFENRLDTVRKDIPHFPEILSIDYKDPGILLWEKPNRFETPQTFFHDLKGLGLKNNSAMDNYNLYSAGRGGACGLWTNFWDESSSLGWDYHCGNVTDGGWEEVDELMNTFGILNIPIGMIYDSTILSNFKNWKLNLDSTQRINGAAVLNVWMTQGWFNNFFYVTNHSVINTTAGELSFLADDGVYPLGGWQGGRHWQTQDSFTTGGHVGPLLGNFISVSNVFEELDTYDEYYYDVTTQMLYVYYNASDTQTGNPQAPPPNGLVFMAPQLEVFFNFSSGASDITVSGLGFRDQRVSVLDAWTVPSGGDWGLRPYGSINLKDTERITISNMLFSRLDSNAIFLGGKNRNASILDSECVWLGMNCVASLGETNQDDATGGEQPWGTVLSGIVAHELALFEKQSSAFFLGRTPLSRVENCLFYNGPRAMINVNDHLGGGNNFTTSLLFNTCRESGDHGAMNSWNRMPFLSEISSVPGASYYPQLSETLGVFGIGNYGASQSYDNDDGSSFDHTHDNYFALSDGFKMDYGGSNSIFHNNVVIVRPYDGQNCFNMWNFVPGHQDILFNNTCAIWPNLGTGNPRDADMVLSQNDCGACATDRSATPHFSNNHFYTTHGNASANCGGSWGTTLAELRSKFPDYEAGSTWTTLPTPEQVIQWGRDVLHM